MEPVSAPEAMMTAARLDEPLAALADFDAVVRLYWPGVFRFALASVRDIDAAQTIAQDCFLRAHRSRQRFRGDCSLQTWLMQIAVNLVRDYGRNRRLQFWRRTQIAAVDLDAAGRVVAGEDLSPEARVSVAQEVSAVWQAAARLSERQRTVFLLRFVEDMELLEIVAATGMREGTVKVHLFRALQTIRKELGREA
jgi:RNA polymerase sigma-70 factor (ECF subfamily)